MKERIDKINVLYVSWQMQCCGDPVEVGRATTLTIDTGAEITDLAGFHIDFYEEHHGEANAKIRGLVVGIKAVFVDKLAYENAYYDNPNNTFSVYDATFIDGFQDKGDYGNHRICDVDYYIITMEDIMLGEYEGRYEYQHNIEEILLEPFIGGDKDVMIKNGHGEIVGGLTGVTILSKGRKERIQFPAELREALFRWFAEYRAFVHDGFLVWSQDDWNNWYARGWNMAKMMKELLPDDVHLYYGTVGMSQGVIEAIRGSWQIKESMFNVEIINDMTKKTKEGTYIPSAYADIKYDDKGFSDCDHGIYKFMIPKSEHHLFPNDTLILQNPDEDEDQEDMLATILEILDDGIIVEVSGYLVFNCGYSIELVE